MSEHRVAVIGAGPCGLAACKALGEFGVDYECFEASDGVGGIWNVERGVGGGYRSLETNTSIGGMCFADFPFPDGHTPYASAAQMVDYFQSYADHFSLEARIRFGQRVERARPRPEGGWQITLEDGTSRRYGGLIVATGQYNAPKRPHGDVPGAFSGEQLHVFDYLDPTTPVDCRGKRVVVVGLGSSAAEVASELSNPDSPWGASRRVILSARSGRWVMPKVVDGEPIDSKSIHPAKRLPALLRALPGESSTWLMRRVFAKLLRGQWSRLDAEALGLPKPSIDPWADRPTLSVDFIPALQDGRIEVRPGIRRFAGETVHFTDGSEAEADVVLYATGYQLDFPYLDRDALGCDAPDLALYQRIAHPSHDDLFFVGCCRVLCSMWPLAEQQSRWVARLLSGAFSLPSREARTRQAVGLASTLPVMCNAYVEELRREARGL